MALKLPGSEDLSVRGRTGLEVFDHEVISEMAASLGHAGRKVEALMARLNDPNLSEAERPDVLAASAKAVFAYFVQRELCGLRRHDDVIRDYRIPRAVLARLGAV